MTTTPTQHASSTATPTVTSTAAAIVVQEGLSQAGIKALLIAGLLLVANPVLTHATGRALYIRQRDHLEAEDTGP